MAGKSLFERRMVALKERGFETHKRDLENVPQTGSVIVVVEKERIGILQLHRAKSYMEKHPQAKYYAVLASAAEEIRRMC
jgi:hypothetical protein